MEVAAVLKGLLLLAQTKPLSFREKKMLERARYLLVSEVAMAKNWEEAARGRPDVEGTGEIASTVPGSRRRSVIKQLAVSD